MELQNSKRHDTGRGLYTALDMHCQQFISTAALFPLLFSMPLHLSKKGIGEGKRMKLDRKRAAAPLETRHPREAFDE